jgi:hypothetical protein
VVHAVHWVAFAVVEYVPLPQVVQAWSEVAVPAVLTYVPAPHVVHAVHESWSACVE